MLDVANLTPFAYLTFAAVDASEQMTHVVVAKATYDLKPADGAPGTPTFALEFAEGSNDLFVTDEYFGALNKSSVRTESDLAPLKPRCDLIVIGSAYSPTGHPANQVKVGIDIGRNGVGVHSHSLLVHGERDLVRRDLLDRSAAAVVWLASAGSVRAPEWVLSEAKPFTECPLRYELTFGGEMRIEAADECAGRVDEHDKLSAAVRGKHPDGEGAPIAHKTCGMNPVGRGFIEAWYVEATRMSRYPAPRIESPVSPFTAELFDALVKGKETPGSSEALTPQGFGVVTKSWQPRLKLAGTYDDVWRKTRWPNPPPDYDMGYWNGAHPSMQCEHLRGGEIVTLTNLLPHRSPGTRAAREDATVASFRVPDDEPALHLELAEKRVFLAILPIDTLTIDLEAMRVHIVWRIGGPAELSVKEASLICVASLRADEATDDRVVQVASGR